MGMDVNGKIGVFLSNRTDQQCRGMGLQYTSHVLDTQDINVKSDKLVNETKVVLEVVLLTRTKHCSK
jgi:hypothetical protein